MIDVECHQCQTHLRLGDEWAGKKGRCPRCHAVLDLPAVQVIEAEEVLPLPDDWSEATTVTQRAVGAPEPSPAQADRETVADHAKQTASGRHKASAPAAPPASKGPAPAARPDSAAPPAASAPARPIPVAPPAKPSPLSIDLGGLPPAPPRPSGPSKGLLSAPFVFPKDWKTFRRQPYFWPVAGLSGAAALLILAILVTSMAKGPKARSHGPVAETSQAEQEDDSGKSGRAETPSQPSSFVAEEEVPPPPPPSDPRPAVAQALPRPTLPARSERTTPRTSSSEAAAPRQGGGLVGVGREYDDLHCQRIQFTYGIRIPSAATIIEVDGLRLPIESPGKLGESVSPMLLLPRGVHAVRFRATESPVEVTVKSDFRTEYDAMRKFFRVGDALLDSELLGRGARAMDVHGAPFLLNFTGGGQAEQEKHDVAERQFRRALCVNPTFSPAHLNLAECLLRRKARAEAVREIEFADIFNVGNVYGIAGATARLRQKLKIPMEQRGPIDVSALSYISQEKLSEEDERLVALMDGISKYAVKSEERGKILNNLAVHFADTNRPETALHWFRNALAVVKASGGERFSVARQIFSHMSDVCQQAGFAEAEQYRKMQNLVTP